MLRYTPDADVSTVSLTSRSIQAQRVLFSHACNADDGASPSSTSRAAGAGLARRFAGFFIPTAHADDMTAHHDDAFSGPSRRPQTQRLYGQCRPADLWGDDTFSLHAVSSTSTSRAAAALPRVCRVNYARHQDAIHDEEEKAHANPFCFSRTEANDNARALPDHTISAHDDLDAPVANAFSSTGSGVEAQTRVHVDAVDDTHHTRAEKQPSTAGPSPLTKADEESGTGGSDTGSATETADGVTDTNHKKTKKSKVIVPFDAHALSAPEALEIPVAGAFSSTTSGVNGKAEAQQWVVLGDPAAKTAKIAKKNTKAPQHFCGTAETASGGDASAPSSNNSSRTSVPPPPPPSVASLQQPTSNNANASATSAKRCTIIIPGTRHPLKPVFHTISEDDMRDDGKEQERQERLRQQCQQAQQKHKHHHQVLVHDRLEEQSHQRHNAQGPSSASRLLKGIQSVEASWHAQNRSRVNDNCFGRQ